MADVTLVQTTQVQNVTTGGQQAQTTVAVNKLPPGTIVNGTITGKDANGNFLLRTNIGTIPLRSATPLPYNSDVSIRIDANNTNATSARIVSVNGEPFAEFSAPEPETPQVLISPDVIAKATQATDDTASPTVLRGTVVSLQPAEPATQTPGNSGVPAPTPAAALPQGSNVVIRLADGSVDIPAQNADPTQGASQPDAPAQTLASPTSPSQGPSTDNNTVPINVARLIAPQPPITQPSSLNTPLPSLTAATDTELPQAVAAYYAAEPAQNDDNPATSNAQYASYARAQTDVAQLPAGDDASQANATAQNATPPQAGSNGTQATPAQPNVTTSQTPASPPASTAIPAQVVSVGSNGIVTVQTPTGNVSVQLSANAATQTLTPGTNVTLELPDNVTPPLTPTAAVAAPPATLTELAATWSSLSDILNVLSSTDEAAANSLMQKLPQLGPQFMSTSTSFIATLIQGNAKNLLGNNAVESLQQSGHQDLIDKFSAEVTALSGAMTQPMNRQVPNWQMMLIPFTFQEELQQARLFVKREPPKKQSANASTSPDTRFIVEISLSEMGPLQLDGLVRLKPKATAFDLVIRSRTPFSADDQSQMLEIYNSTAEITGFQGSLGFQVTQNFPVKPLLEMAMQDKRDITV